MNGLEVNRVYEGNCLDLFKELDDKSIDMVCTSPPYWSLRDYKWDGQWGLENNFYEYLEHLWQMMEEVWRVLKDEGTVWINLGDTYASGTRDSNGIDKSRTNSKEGKHVGEWHEQPNRKMNYYKQKCLCLIPHRFAIGCIDRGWIVRNDILWAKRNGMPESVTDRFSKKHEYFFLMVKQEKYYFDLDGIRDKHKQASIERWYRAMSEDNKWVNGADGQTPHNLSQPRGKKTKIPKEQAEMYGSPRARYHRPVGEVAQTTKYNQETPDTGVGNLRNASNPLNEDGKNPGDVSDFWDIPTQPSSDEHYAAYNDKLIGKPIVAGCPKGGIILDPFCGTATTGCRAIELSRNFIGFDGSPKYVEMSNRNLKPYLQQTKLFT